MRIHILGVPRGGTSYMYDIVRRYHAPLQTVEFGNEPFHDTLYNKEANELAPIFKKHIAKNRIQKRSVIKTHVQHLLSLNECRQLENFKDSMDYNIAMVRRNIFDVTLSSIVSTTQHEWYDYDNQVTPMKVELELFEHWWRGVWWDMRRIYQDEFKLDYNEVVYYDSFTRSLRKDWAGLKLCNTYFTCLADLKSYYDKAPPKETVVSNYQQLKEFAHQLAARDEYSELKIDDDFNLPKIHDYNHMLTH